MSRLGQASKMANTAKNNRTDSSNRPTTIPPAGTLGTTLGTIQSTATTVQNTLQRGMDTISDLAARLGMPPVVASSVPFNVIDSRAMFRKLDESDRAQFSKVEPGGNMGIYNGYNYWDKTTQFKNVKVYQRDDIINPNMKDARGRTNLERMQKGLAPLGPDGKSINLHHTTQRNESSIAEVTQTFHKDNSSVIHINPNTIPSGINRSEFNKWRTDYWKNRANDF
ncbi:HNH/ENDO VII family nuclease [Halalkalibacter sp. AB-rgal2]|uniref:HNH/ENDO VII family nuclease n=1 Tax=Halalkalibacter sp. AB-rgal2 TaxID=3242695 RepID=UPI00359E99A0